MKLVYDNPTNSKILSHVIPIYKPIMNQRLLINWCLAFLTTQ